MFNVLLEHFVVSPEILRLKQRMFFVLYWEGCFLLEKKKNLQCHCGLQKFLQKWHKFSTKTFFLKTWKKRRLLQTAKKM